MSPRLLFFFLIFAVSGATGLIYESLWTRYLKLFLGHSAYAQTLVLMLFMGGMALGAWLASRLVDRRINPLIAYAVIEALVGLYAIGFHSIFTGLMDTSYMVLFPAIGSPAAIEVVKWLLASLLVLPASVLLGATFPLMVTGLMRLVNVSAGKLIALLYFLNSFGAATGVLIGGFWMVGQFGLPGTMLTAGAVNVLIALLVYLVIRDVGAAESMLARSDHGQQQTSQNGAEDAVLLLLGVSFFTGFASFVYEIAWIRMLSLVLGSSNHAFEMMLSAFVLGLAIGGFWVRNRIDRMDDSLLFLGKVQVVMGLMALFSMLAYEQSFYWMQWTIEALARTDTGYLAFNVISHGIALLVMLPATICAGMTLPVITHRLLRTEAGEAAVGRVYAVNTLGAILGVFFSVQLLMPIIGLQNLLTFGAAIDILLGLAIFYRVSWRALPVATVGSMLLGTLIYLQVDLAVERLASGVYRDGVLYEKIDSLFHRDGRTASVDVFDTGNVRTIATNGKSDASVAISGNLSPDEFTMALLGAVPLLLNPDAQTAATVGMGSGITSHVLLASPTLERLDTIEIEQAMVDGARLFGDRSERTFSDPRSHIVIDDAKTYFVKNNRQYDLVVSEPSNPWVSGVASVFSREFYELVASYLSEDGLFVQWLHLYEINDTLVFSVLNALNEQFADYEIYTSVSGDLIIVAAREGRVPQLQDSALWHAAAMRSELDRLDIRHLDDIRVRHLAGKREVTLLSPLYPEINTDYFPFLDLNATRARFRNQNSTLLLALKRTPLPLQLLTRGEDAESTGYRLTETHHTSNVLVTDALRARRLAASFGDAEVSLPESDRFLKFRLDAIRFECHQRIDMRTWERALLELSGMLTWLTDAELLPVWSQLTDRQCEDEMSQRAAAWIELLKLTGERRFAETGDLAARLLASGSMDPDVRAYLLQSQAFSLAVRGELPEALAIMEQGGLLAQHPTTANRLIYMYLLGAGN